MSEGLLGFQIHRGPPMKVEYKKYPVQSALRMNKIGFNVLACLSAGVTDELLPILDRLKSIGYDGVEFFIGGSG